MTEETFLAVQVCSKKLNGIFRGLVRSSSEKFVPVARRSYNLFAHKLHDSV